MNKLFKKIVVLTMVATMALTAVGCYGSFALTKKVHQWNGSLGNKWVIELVYLVISYPVYGTAGFIDSVILNSIEFWTGSNPMASTMTSDDGATITFNEATKEVTVAYGEQKYSVAMIDGKATMKNAEGVAIAYAESDANGTFTIKDMSGKVLSVQTASEIETMLAQK